MADTNDDANPSGPGAEGESPEELEHAKLFEEFAARHRTGAASAAPSDASRDADDKGDAGTDGTSQTDSGDTAAAAAATAAPGDTKAATTPTPEDIWADATPAQKAAHDAALATNEAFEQYKRSNEGRVSGFQRQIDDLSKALAGRATASTSAAATAADNKVDDATKSLNDVLNDPDFLAAEKEYPEIYKPMRKTMGAVLAKAANLEAEIGTLRSTTTTKFERDDLREQSAEIVRLDPDYVEIVSKPDFQPAFDKWLQEQPLTIREMVVNAAAGGVKNAADTSWAFRRFKSDTGFGGGQAAATGAQPAATSSTSSATDRTRRALQLDSSTTVRSSRPSATPNSKDGAGDTVDADWKRNVDRINKRRQAEGVAY